MHKARAYNEKIEIQEAFYYFLTIYVPYLFTVLFLDDSRFKLNIGRA